MDPVLNFDASSLRMPESLPLAPIRRGSRFIDTRMALGNPASATKPVFVLDYYDN